jgi:hypothetical protein
MKITMDEIERGFSLLVEKIGVLREKKAGLSQEILERDVSLLHRMAESSAPLIPDIGLSMLQKGKQDNQGEVYDAQYFKQKMLLLGKTDPVPYRPDDATKTVSDQFCVLGEDGAFYELMYSSDGFSIDTYLHPLTPQEVLQLYGYEIMFMLYRAMHDYMDKEKDLVAALEKTLDYIFAAKRQETRSI